jgi:hypothetical protein
MLMESYIFIFSVRLISLGKMFLRFICVLAYISILQLYVSLYEYVTPIDFFKKLLSFFRSTFWAIN